MIRPCLSVNMRSLGLSAPNALTQGINVSGMGIKSKFCRTIFLPEINAMNLYMTWRFPLGPRQMDPLVLGAWLLCEISSSCTWQFYNICRRRCFLKYKVSPDMMVLGLILCEIPPFVVNKFNIFTALMTIRVVRRFIIFWKRRPWWVSLHCYFINLIYLYMSGMC